MIKKLTDLIHKAIGLFNKEIKGSLEMGGRVINKIAQKISGLMNSILFMDVYVKMMIE